MKKLTVFLAFALVAPGIIAGEIDLQLKCSLKSYYSKITADVGIDFSKNMFIKNGPEGGKWKVSWSATECEDYSEITFNEDRFKQIAAGEINSINGHFKHDEPGVTIEASLSCIRQNDN